MCLAVLLEKLLRVQFGLVLYGVLTGMPSPLPSFRPLHAGFQHAVGGICVTCWIRIVSSGQPGYERKLGESFRCSPGVVLFWRVGLCM